MLKYHLTTVSTLRVTVPTAMKAASISAHRSQGYKGLEVTDHLDGTSLVVGTKTTEVKEDFFSDLTMFVEEINELFRLRDAKRGGSEKSRGEKVRPT